MMNSSLTTEPSRPTACDKLDQRSIELRQRIVAMLLDAGRGHLAPALSVIEILRVLYDDILRYDPSQPRWSGRDRFILSKGHACMAQYVLLAEKGFFPEELLKTFCGAGSILGGHPEYPHVPGVEASTGSLGHGPSIGLGMALNARHEGTGARVFVVVGDGESDEGSVWEAALSGAKHGLENLILIVDYNKFQSYGPTQEVMGLEPLADKWRAFGWGVIEVDGHDVGALRTTFSNLPLAPGKPSVVICHTIKGAGIDIVEHNLQWHHKSGLRDEEAKALLQGIGRKHA
jgi:transketolase